MIALLAIVAVLALAGTASAAEPADTFAPRLSAIASELAGHDISVYCHTFTDMTAGLAFPSNSEVWLARDVCRGVKSAPRVLASPGYPQVGTPGAIHVFGHEIGHARVLDDEADTEIRAECYGYAHVRDLALRLGFRKKGLQFIVRAAHGYSWCKGDA